MSDVARIDFKARQGSDFERTLTFYESGPGYPDDPGDKTPLDLTGASAAMQVRLHPRAEPVLSLSSGDGITIDGGAITITIPGEALTGIEPLTYGYDLELTTETGTTALAEGSFAVAAEWTR